MGKIIFVPGQRYSITKREAYAILAQSWPAVTGEPDLTRGRLFKGEPCDWSFWMQDGTRVDFSFNPGQHFIASQSREVDTNRPEPLRSVA